MQKCDYHHAVFSHQEETQHANFQASFSTNIGIFGASVCPKVKIKNKSDVSHSKDTNTKHIFLESSFLWNIIERSVLCFHCTAQILQKIRLTTIFL